MAIRIICADCRDALKRLPADYFHTCITSPPYWSQRDYGDEAVVEWADGWRGQLGHEPDVDMYVAHLVEVFREVWRVLRGDGTLWLNLGDSYAGSGSPGGDFRNGGGDRYLRPYARQGKSLKPKDLCGVPWRVALALQADGADWAAVQAIARAQAEIMDAYQDEPLPDKVMAILERLANEYAEAKGSSWWLRSDIVWEKPTSRPESVKDRPSKSHEYVFLLAKSRYYFYDWVAVQEPIAADTAARARRALGAGKYVNGCPGKQAETSMRPREADPTRPVCATRNRRTVWRVSPTPFHGAHYSVFPPKLIEPMVLAGTSQAGCCAQCGAPYERVLEGRPSTFNYRVREVCLGRAKKDPQQFHASDSEVASYTGEDRDIYWHRTIGWVPSCSCGVGQVPCRVLDPFGGSGTTALVAERLARDSVLIEIKPEFVQMAQDRLRSLGELLTHIEVEYG